MVTEPSRQGLIVSASPLATPALREVSDYCGWPVLLQATARQLRSEMQLGVPKLSLFWLDDDQYVGTTLQLMSWLAMCEPAVRRVAIGYRMRANIEVAMRSASAHLYLAADGDLRSLLGKAISPWLRGPDPPAALAREELSTVQPDGDSQARDITTLHPSGPP